MNVYSLHWVLAFNKNFDNSLAQIIGTCHELSSNGLNQHVSQDTEVTIFLPFDVVNEIVEDLKAYVSMEHGTIFIRSLCHQETKHESFVMIR